MDYGQILKNSFLYMYEEGLPIHDFLKNCDVHVSDHYGIPKTRTVTFTVSAPTFKRHEYLIEAFRSKLKEDLHKLHQFNSVKVDLTADWEKLEIVSTRIEPILTPWQEINKMQDNLMTQMQLANDTIFFQNVGNTCRHLLMKLADVVFDSKKHTPTNNSFDLGRENSKNRLWAFVLYKFPNSSTNDKVREYAESLLNCADKGINLSNTVTHALKADNFLAQSCAISTITIVHFIKLANERQEPA
jgi:hypothetical protein